VALYRIAQASIHLPCSMVGSNMMMIPGEWEPRRRSGAATVGPVVEPLTSAPPLEASRGDNGPAPDTERRELPVWLKVSIFAATLLGTMWLSMAVFVERAAG